MPHEKLMIARLLLEDLKVEDVYKRQARGFHLFPFRTEKLRLVTPMVTDSYTPLDVYNRQAATDYSSNGYIDTSFHFMYFFAVHPRIFYLFTKVNYANFHVSLCFIIS